MRNSARTQAARARRAIAAVLVAAALAGGAAACGGNGPASPRSTSPQAGGPQRTAPAMPTETPRERRAAGPSGHPPVAWTIARVVRRLAGRRIEVEGRSVPLDADTLTCGGEGPELRRAAQPAWTRFRCLQPTFPPGGLAGPDAVFIVQPTGPRAFVVRGGRFTAY